MLPIAISALNNVPTKYFSANDLFSNCLNLAKLFAVNTNPIAPNCPINPSIPILQSKNLFLLLHFLYFLLLSLFDLPDLLSQVLF